VEIVCSNGCLSNCVELIFSGERRRGGVVRAWRRRRED